MPLQTKLGIMPLLYDDWSAMNSCRIVLVETSHPGNIGAAARAMRVMGLSELALVSPKIFPSPKADALASGALDVLENAKLFDTLADALADCSFAYAATARNRYLAAPDITPREMAAEAVTRTGKVALVFGAERTGLTNEQLALCQRLVHIPTANDYSALNLAQAVQVLSYELFLAQHHQAPTPPKTHQAVDLSQMAHFYTHLEHVLIEAQFLHPDNPRQLMRRLRHLFDRAEPDQNEINILRGILSALAPKSSS